MTWMPRSGNSFAPWHEPDVPVLWRSSGVHRRPARMPGLHAPDGPDGSGWTVGGPHRWSAARGAGRWLVARGGAAAWPGCHRVPRRKPCRWSAGGAQVPCFGAPARRGGLPPVRTRIQSPAPPSPCRAGAEFGPPRWGAVSGRAVLPRRHPLRLDPPRLEGSPRRRRQGRAGPRLPADRLLDARCRLGGRPPA